MPLHRPVRSALLATAVVAVAAVATLAPGASASAADPIAVTAAPVAQLGAKGESTRLTLKNTTSRRLRGLTLSVGKVKGVNVRVAGSRRGSRARRLPALAPGATVRVKVTLRRLKGGPATGALPVRVVRKGKTLVTGRVRFGGQSGPTPPPPNPDTLAGRYFWTSLYSLNGTAQMPLYFTSDTLVSNAEHEGGAWPVCAAPSEECLPYAYRAEGNQLTIGGVPATLDGRTLELDGDTYLELGFPPAGARFDTTVTYANSSGLCPLYCSYFREDLTFLPDGTFIRDSVSSGTGPVVDWAVVPDDQKGTYEVRADRTLRLLYADGEERIDTIALYLADDGSLQPAGEGMILSGEGYFDIRD